MRNLKNIVRTVVGLTLIGGLYWSHILEKKGRLYKVAPVEVVDKLHDGKYLLVVLNDKECEWCEPAKDHHNSLRADLEKSDLVSMMEMDVNDCSDGLKKYLGVENLPFYALLSLDDGVIATHKGYVWNPADKSFTHHDYLVWFLGNNIPGFEINKK